MSDNERLRGRELATAFSGLLLAMLLSALDATIVATALPTIVGELGGLERLGWVVTAYLLAQTVVTPIFGKLGDLYGRKVVLQSAIGLFLVGSALCGAAGSMGQLIAFRALQGLGGGGLMVSTQAAIGDIVPPRERGRYQGIFGAVFGVSSIAGPLLGGYFTTHLSWRWIFYINVPLGAVAAVVIGATLPRAAERVRRTIDYAGAALLAITLSAVVLVTDLGGIAFPWRSPQIAALAAVAVIALSIFLVVERRAREPVMPLRLFSNRTFGLTSAIGLIVGFAMFGSVTYLPLFLQVVGGASPTASGLQMLPMMGGMLLTSITAGQIISRTGRYKRFPIAGTAVMSVGLFLLSRMTAGTTILEASVGMLVLGLGMGMVMQVLVIAVQNAVAYDDLGVATSGATLFRLIGGALGTAVFGAIFAAGLTDHLAAAFPGGAPTAALGSGVSPEVLERLPAVVRDVYVEGVATSLSTVFLIAMFIAIAGFALTWMVPEQPLRETIAAAAGDVGAETEQVFPLPTDTDSISKLERFLSLLASRDLKREYIHSVVARARADISPLAAWLLVRIDRDPETQPEELARRYDIDSARLAGAAAELRDRGLVAEVGNGGAPPRRIPTAPGTTVLRRLAAARRARLAEVLGEWAPEQRQELVRRLRRLTKDIVVDGSGA